MVPTAPDQASRRLDDPQGRTIRYLRLSVTDRCNYRCTYCMPEEGVDHVERDGILSFEEICTLVSCFTRLGVDRVLFDTSALFAAKAVDEATLDAKRRKPRLPFRRTHTGRHPFVRYVGDPDLDVNDAALARWAGIAAEWLGAGLEPYFFVHHPDDAHAPALARRLQRALHAALPSLPPPPAWPCEHPARGQLSLF